MSVRMTEDEAWAELGGAHTGIFTSLRRDGSPVALPVWFVAVDRAIYVSTPAGSKKVARVRNDSRASFLVERGDRWAELAAVHVPVRAELVDDPGEQEKVARLMSEKYDAYRTSRSRMPDATKAHYGNRGALIRLIPDGRILTWDNAKLRLNQ